MLVLAPAACILSGIALSQAFEVFTRSIKFQKPGEALDTQEVNFIPLVVLVKFMFAIFFPLTRPSKWN